MRPAKITGVRRLRTMLGGGLTAVVMALVPLLALAVVPSWGRGRSATEAPPAIAASDDAVANGFRIVTPPGVVPAAKPAADPAGETEAVTLLRDWQFTRGGPSTGG
jgi:hypothetical protein